MEFSDPYKSNNDPVEDPFGDPLDEFDRGGPDEPFADATGDDPTQLSEEPPPRRRRPAARPGPGRGGRGGSDDGDRQQLLIRRAIALGAGLLLVLGEALVGPSLPWVMAGFFVYVASMGFIGPNAAAAALATHGQMAGKASALMGSLQFGLATLAGGLVGLWHDGGTRPLMVIMALGGIGAWLALRWVEARLPRGRRPRP